MEVGGAEGPRGRSFCWIQLIALEISHHVFCSLLRPLATCAPRAPLRLQKNCIHSLVRTNNMSERVEYTNEHGMMIAGALG